MIIDLVFKKNKSIVGNSSNSFEEINTALKNIDKIFIPYFKLHFEISSAKKAQFSLKKNNNNLHMMYSKKRLSYLKHF